MKTKFAIGCLVQWYECDIIGEYLDSLKDAIDAYDGEILVDFYISQNQDLEKCISDKQLDKCVNKIEKSTGTFLKGKTTCEGKTHSYEMKVTNPKTIEVKLQMDNDKGPKKLNFKMFWVSSECAKG